MNGRRVFKFGVNAICDTVHKLASDAGISVEDIDHFVFHQANERILSQAVKRLGVPDDTIALVGFGAGLDIGGYLLRWK